MRRRFVFFAAAASAVLTMLIAAGVTAQSPLTPTEQLGKFIFEDERLSINENQSCATCHGREAGWTGPDSAINAHGTVYEGSVPGAFGDRKPPSVAYATQSPILHRDKKGLFVGGNFWDGRATGEKLGNPAADQAQGPFLNPKEQALPDVACVVYKVCAASYPVSFESVWGAGKCAIAWPSDVETQCSTPGAFLPLSPADREQANQNYDSIAFSIAAYEASAEVNAFGSKFDYSKKGMAKLGKEEQAGHSLFLGKAKCARCHIASGQQPLFTDYTFDNLGLPKNPENPFYVEFPGFVDVGLGGFLASRTDYAAYAAANMGKHKVPTTRNVALGPEGLVKAYGHNGYFKSLWGIVHFYNTRDVLDRCPGDYTEAEALAANCWPAPEVPENVNTAELGNLGLSPDEEAAIVAFLKTLSDGYEPVKKGNK
jgi:cytochrome c peroxidase